jgi:hypothetical protein
MIAEPSGVQPAAVGGESAPTESQEPSIEAASAVDSGDGAPAPARPPATAETSEAQGGASGAEEDKPEDELIEVWRPAPGRSRHAGGSRPRPQRGAEAAAAAVEDAARPQQPARKPWRDRRHAAGSRSAQPAAGGPNDQNPPGEAERAAPEPAREARRPSWWRDSPKGARVDDGRAAASTGADKTKPRPPPEPHKPSVNLDSPFAKLLDLKPLLKARDTTK